MNFSSGTESSGAQQQQVNPWLAFAAGTATGAVADSGMALVSRTVADAKWGKWLSLANTGVSLYTGNGATAPINAAAVANNKVAAGATYAQADAVNTKAALANVVTALQSLNPLQALGISDKTANTAAPGETAPVATNSGVGLVAGVILGVVISKSM